jgi:hypothetical protein
MASRVWRESIEPAQAVGNVQHRLFAQDDGVEGFEIEFCDDGTRAIDFLFFGEQQGGGADFENVHNLRGNAVEQLDYVAGFQQALAEGVEFFDFAASLRGVLGFLTGAGGKVAGQYRDNQKGEKRNPILRVGDGEAANGRQEIIVEREHCYHGHEDGNGDAPYGGNG